MDPLAALVERYPDASHFASTSRQYDPLDRRVVVGPHEGYPLAYGLERSEFLTIWAPGSSETSFTYLSVGLEVPTLWIGTRNRGVLVGPNAIEIRYDAEDATALRENRFFALTTLLHRMNGAALPVNRVVHPISAITTEQFDGYVAKGVTDPAQANGWHWGHFKSERGSGISPSVISWRGLEVTTPYIPWARESATSKQPQISLPGSETGLKEDSRKRDYSVEKFAMVL
ncbi:MAG: hypothetical protein Q7S65_02180 [Nanoarchaeota archaeon]|nr:hypothetical protein [Nanoarchaeota archaeon]